MAIEACRQRGLLIFCLFISIGYFSTTCSQSDPDPNNSTCKTNQDCKNNEFCENDGKCYPVVVCEKDEDCAEDEICGPDKECRKKDLICTKNEDCGDGKYCEKDGKCYPIVECEKDEDCGPNEYCGPMNECRKKDSNDPPICDEVAIEATSVPPNLLLVVDRSGSMKRATSSGSDRTKLEDTQDAIHALLNSSEGKIRFGWMQFPGASTCTPGIVSVDCSDTSVPLIRSKVDNLTANGGTPTGESLENANAYQGLHDTSRENFVVLLTDGMPSCPDGNGTIENLESDANLTRQAVSDLHSDGIDTFVIGLGEDVNASNPDLLNDLADLGGRARDGAIKYYQANSLDELNTVLEEIGGMVLGCSQALGVVPEEPNYLWVYFDGVAVPRDPNHLEGFDYDPEHNKINFYGQACEKLRTGLVNKLDIKMGCAPPA